MAEIANVRSRIRQRDEILQAEDRARACWAEYKRLGQEPDQQRPVGDGGLQTITGQPMTLPASERRRRIAQQIEYYKGLAKQAPAAIEANKQDEGTIPQLQEEKSECEKAVLEPANHDYGR